MAESRHYGDNSTGIVAIPLWASQAFMVAGWSFWPSPFLTR